MRPIASGGATSRGDGAALALAWVGGAAAMIQAPITPFLLVLFALLLGIFVFVLEMRALAYAYRAIGISPRYVTAVLLLTLLGSYVNLPLYAVEVPRVVPPQV